MIRSQSYCTTHGRDTVICVNNTEHIGLIKEMTSGIAEPRNRGFLLQVHNSPNWHRPRYPSGVDLQVLKREPSSQSGSPHTISVHGHI